MKYMERIKLTFFAILGLSALLHGACINAQTSRVAINGRVLLDENGRNSPGDYVMVYAKQYGIGTLSDADGNFSLNIVTAEDRISLEFSRIGYSVIDTTLVLDRSTAETRMEPIVMEPQALMLMAAYVSDDNRSPAEVILSNVWDRSKKIRSKPFDYRADVEYKVATHEIPVVAKVMPKLALGAVKLAFGVEGFGPLVRYCLKNDDFSAHVTMSRMVKDMTPHDFNKKLVWSDKPLPSDVQRNVLDAFGMFDIFDIMYGDSASWGKQFSKKHRFTLTGTYEYGDQLVDVLKCTDHTGKTTAVLHIVEQAWAIMKVQIITAREGEVLRLEARDIGNGVYMPISLVIKPSVSRIRAEQIPEAIESVKASKSIPKKSRERMIKVLEEHQGKDFNPYISIYGNVRYRL